MTRHIGNTFVAAAIALTLCILSSFAHAGPWECGAAGCVLTREGAAALSASTITGGALPITVDTTGHLMTCLDGWTMVDVQTSNGHIVKKCAAVGDLRDPQ